MQCWCVQGSGCCYRLVTMLGAWFYAVLVCTRLWLLLSPSDNARSMVLYSICMNHALADANAQFQ